MNRMVDRRIVLLVAEEDYASWEAAFSFYDVSRVAPEDDLTVALQAAAGQSTDLFVIQDGLLSDETILKGIQAFREASAHQNPLMRIVFLADEKRETPSYFFRVLVNLDVMDIIVPPKEKGAEFNKYKEIAEVLAHPKCYSDVVALLTGSVLNPRLIGLSSSEEMRERTRPQIRIAVGQIDQRRGGSTHTSILLARTLVLLGYKVAVFVDARTWKNLRRCYPRARCNAANGLIVLSGLDFYRNEGFARVNGYDYVVADFGCARWLDINETPTAVALEESFKTAQLGVLTSVVSPFGDHAPLERVFKIWQKKGQLQNLGGVTFAFFGLPNDRVLENWRTAAQQLNPNAKLLSIPYLPDPLHYEPGESHASELIEILAPVLRPKDR